MKKKTSKDKSLKSSMDAIISRKCEICFQENRHYDGSLFQQGLLPLNECDYLREMIHCRQCNHAYHGLCLNLQSTKGLTVVEIPQKEGKHFQQIVFDCKFCSKPPQSKKCAICQNPQYLNAKLDRGDGSDLEDIHLLCGLFSSQYRLKNLENFTFETQENVETVSIIEECQYCHNQVMGCGVQCEAQDCRKSAHLRCALQTRGQYLSRNRDLAIEFTGSTGLSFNALKEFWLVSCGLFTREGDYTFDPSKAGVYEALKDCEIIKSLKMQGFDEDLIEGLLLKVRTELCPISLGQESRVDEVCIKMPSSCELHKERKPHYCFCGVNEEIVDVGGDQDRKEFHSLFCGDCGIWYHLDCVSLEPGSKATENYQCMKCKKVRALYNKVGDFKDLQRSGELAFERQFRKERPKANNFLRERTLNVLKRDNVLVIDYLMVLRALSKNVDDLTETDLEYWKGQFPFSIQYIQQLHLKKVVMKTVLGKHLSLTLSQKLARIFEANCSQVSNLSSINFKNIETQFLQFKVLVKDISSMLEGRLDNLYQDLQQVGLLLSKLGSQKIAFEQISILMNRLDSIGQLQSGKFAGLLKEFQGELAGHLGSISQGFRNFMEAMTGLDFLENGVNKKQLVRVGGLSKVMKNKMVSEFAESLLQQMRKNFQVLKPPSSCHSIQNLKENCVAAIKSLFFTDFTTLPILEDYIDHYKTAVQWNAELKYYKNRVGIQRSLTEDDLVISQEYLPKLVTVQEIDSLLSIKEKYRSLLDSQELLRLREARNNCREEASSFKEILEDFITRGIAISDRNLSYLKKWIVQQKVDLISRGGLPLDEPTFFKVKKAYLNLEPTPPPNKMHLEALEEIENIIERVGDPEYLYKLEPEEKFDSVIETFNTLSGYKVSGATLQKLTKLKKPIEWVDNLQQAFISEGKIPQNLKRLDFVANYRKVYLLKISDEVLQEFIFTEADRSAQKLAAKFRPFPRLKMIVLGSLKMYYSSLMSKFKNGKKVSVSLALKLNNLRYVLNVADLDDSEFSTRYQTLKNVVIGVTQLAGEKNFQLSEFVLEVASLYQEAEILSDFPQFDSSYTRKCIEFLNQARIIVQVLKQVRHFDEHEDLKPSNLPRWIKIYELITSQEFQRLNVAVDQINSAKMVSFLELIKTIIDLQEKLQVHKSVYQKVSKAISNPALQYKLKQRVENLFELPSSSSTSQLLTQVSEYAVLGEEAIQLDGELIELQKLKNHIKEILSISKLLKISQKAGQNFTKSNLEEMQVYISQFFFQRIKKLRTIDSELKEYLQILVLSVSSISTFLKEGLVYDELQTALEHFKDYKQKITKYDHILEGLRIEDLMENVLEQAKYHRKRFYENGDLDPAQFFELYTSISKSRVDILGEGVHNTRNPRNLQRYKVILGRLKTAWEQNTPLTAVVSKQDIDFASHFVLPTKVKVWATQALTASRGDRIWIRELSSFSKMNGYELDLCVSLAKKGIIAKNSYISNLDTSLTQALQEYSYLDTMVDSMIEENQNSSVPSINFDSLVSLLDRVRQSKVQYIDRQVILLARSMDVLLEIIEKQDVPSTKTLYQILDIFGVLYNILKIESCELAIGRIGNVKMEHKEEMSKKEEAEDSFYSLQKSLNSIVLHFLPKVVPIFETLSKIKVGIIKSLEAFASQETKPTIKEVKSKLQSCLLIRDPKNQDVADLDLTMIVDQVADYLQDENVSMSCINLPQDTFETISREEYSSSTTSSYHRRSLESLIESVNLSKLKTVKTLRQLVFRKLKLKNLKKKTMRNRGGRSRMPLASIKTRSSLKARSAMQSVKKNTASAKSSASKKSNRKSRNRGEVKRDYRILFEQKLFDKLGVVFPLVDSENFNTFYSVMKQDFQKSTLKFEDLVRTLDHLELNGEGQKEVVQKLIDERDEDENNCIDLLGKIDLSFLQKNNYLIEKSSTLEDENQSKKASVSKNSLKKRVPQKSVFEVNKIESRILNVLIPKKGSMVNFKRIHTLMPEEVLEKVRVTDIPLKFEVEKTDNFSQSPQWLLDILEGGGGQKKQGRYPAMGGKTSKVLDHPGLISGVVHCPRIERTIVKGGCRFLKSENSYLPRLVLGTSDWFSRIVDLEGLGYPESIFQDEDRLFFVIELEQYRTKKGTKAIKGQNLPFSSVDPEEFLNEDEDPQNLEDNQQQYKQEQGDSKRGSSKNKHSKEGKGAKVTNLTKIGIQIKKGRVADKKEKDLTANKIISVFIILRCDLVQQNISQTSFKEFRIDQQCIQGQLFQFFD